jgi:hypothetical protein
MWQKIDDLLKIRLSEMGLARGVEANGVCTEFERLIKAELGETVPVRAVSFKTGRLKVEVTGGIWASEVRLRLPALQRKLNKALGGSAIKEIKLVVA